METGNVRTVKTTTHIVLVIYLAFVVAAASLAGVRLSVSTAMPGLQAVELVLLALPWSLALEIEQFSRADLGGMSAILAVGVALNCFAVSSMAGLLRRAWLRK